MKTNSDTNRKRESYRVNFIILPIVFFIVGYLVFYFALTPIIEPAKAIYGVAFSNSDTSAEAAQGKVMYSGKLGNYGGSINASDISFPYLGDTLGTLTIDSISVSAPIIYGDGTAELKKGAGLSTWSRLPGYGNGIIICAHNNTYFHTLQFIKDGATVNIETYYGSYVYEVYLTEVININNPDEYKSKLYNNEEILALYTCYPNNAFASTPYRFFAFCKLVSGPKINEYS